MPVLLTTEDRQRGRDPCSTPRRLTSIIAFQPSTSSSSIRPVLAIPALLHPRIGVHLMHLVEVFGRRARQSQALGVYP